MQEYDYVTDSLNDAIIFGNEPGKTSDPARDYQDVFMSVP